MANCNCYVEPPHVQVTFTKPPPIMPPTFPCTVKPLTLPYPEPEPFKISEEYALRIRHANFYNNYNIDWHPQHDCTIEMNPISQRIKSPKAMTLDGQYPICCEKKAKKLEKSNDPCPTAFLPCQMKITTNDCGLTFNAEIQPCPPKKRPKPYC